MASSQRVAGEKGYLYKAVKISNYATSSSAHIVDFMDYRLPSSDDWWASAYNTWWWQYGFESFCPSPPAIEFKPFYPIPPAFEFIEEINGRVFSCIPSPSALLISQQS